MRGCWKNGFVVGLPYTCQAVEVGFNSRGHGNPVHLEGFRGWEEG